MTDLLKIGAAFALIVLLLRFAGTSGWSCCLRAVFLGSLYLIGPVRQLQGVHRLQPRPGDHQPRDRARADHGAREHHQETGPAQAHDGGRRERGPGPAHRHGRAARRDRPSALGRRSRLLGAHGAGSGRRRRHDARAQGLHQLLVPPHLGILSPRSTPGSCSPPPSPDCRSTRSSSPSCPCRSRSSASARSSASGV